MVRTTPSHQKLCPVSLRGMYAWHEVSMTSRIRWDYRINVVLPNDAKVWCDEKLTLIFYPVQLDVSNRPTITVNCEFISENLKLIYSPGAYNRELICNNWVWLEFFYWLGFYLTKYFRRITEKFTGLIPAEMYGCLTPLSRKYLL